MWNNLMQGFAFGQAQSNTFQQTYRCRSVAFHKPDMEQSGKICLPPSALDVLMRLNIQYPMLFEVMNPKTQQLTHCGVLEFTADEGICYMPYWMMQHLLVEEGGFIEVRNVSLPRGSFVKFQPHSKRFLDISDPKAVLEVQLRNYSCLTKGEVIAFYYLNEPYYMNVIEVKPDTYNAISIVETDLQLDFEAPLDYVEPERPTSSAAGAASSSTTTTSTSGGAVAPSSGSTAKAVGSASKTESSPFSGTGHRLDGKSGTPSHQSPKRVAKPKRTRKVIRGGVLVEEAVEGSSDEEDSSDDSSDGGAPLTAPNHAQSSDNFVPFTGMLSQYVRRQSNKVISAGKSTYRSIVTLPDLAYDYGELEPAISGQIMQIHHSKHHATYVNNLNAALEKQADAVAKNDVAALIGLQSAIKFNGGGHVNHTLFWENLAPKNAGGGGGPDGALAAAIDSQFGSFEQFLTKFNAQTAAVQGSGWGWLVFNKENGRVEITTRPNQDPVSTDPNHVPLLGVDVWEHAYYLDYKNVRPDYLKAIWDVINWQKVSERFANAK